jgi:hypothetical protein
MGYNTLEDGQTARMRSFDASGTIDISWGRQRGKEEEAHVGSHLDPTGRYRLRPRWTDDTPDKSCQNHP